MHLIIQLVNAQSFNELFQHQIISKYFVVILRFEAEMLVEVVDSLVSYYVTSQPPYFWELSGR